MTTLDIRFGLDILHQKDIFVCLTVNMFFVKDNEMFS